MGKTNEDQPIIEITYRETAEGKQKVLQTSELEATMPKMGVVSDLQALAIQQGGDSIVVDVVVGELGGQAMRDTAGTGSIEVIVGQDGEVTGEYHPIGARTPKQMQVIFSDALHTSLPEAAMVTSLTEDNSLIMLI
jgi:hypothetical protein